MFQRGPQAMMVQDMRLVEGVTGLRLPQAAFRELILRRSYHASKGVVIWTMTTFAGYG
jgi:hypothetical protein